MKHALYKHYSADGTLLYVGTAANPLSRTVTHAGRSPWFPEVARIEIRYVANKTAAMNAERSLISEERPLFNVQHRDVIEEGFDQLREKKKKKAMEDNPKTKNNSRIALSIEEAMASVGLSRGMFYRLPEDQRPKASVVGRRRVIMPESLVAWLRDRSNADDCSEANAK